MMPTLQHLVCSDQDLATHTQTMLLPGRSRILAGCLDSTFQLFETAFIVFFLEEPNRDDTIIDAILSGRCSKRPLFWRAFWGVPSDIFWRRASWGVAWSVTWTVA